MNEFPPEPSPDDEYQPNFEEFLEHLGNGTLSELTSSDEGETGIIFIDSRPREEGKLWVNQEGQVVQSFSNKFGQGFEGWKPGDIVNAQFTVSEAKGVYAHPDAKPGLLVSGIDVCHADNFILSDLNPEEAEQIRANGVAVINADVEVTSHGDYKASNMFDYEARIKSINQIQQPWDGETELQSGERALVNGEVVTYTPEREGSGRHRRIETRVKLANGKIVPIEMTQGYINYEGGILDLMYPECPVEGDTVQINTTFGKPFRTHDQPDPPDALNADFCRSAYLVKPSQERLDTYQAHREDIAANLAELADLEGDEFRDAYSKLVCLYAIPRENRPNWHRLIMTDKELTSLGELVENKYPADSWEFRRAIKYGEKQSLIDTCRQHLDQPE